MKAIQYGARLNGFSTATNLKKIASVIDRQDVEFLAVQSAHEGRVDSEFLAELLNIYQMLCSLLCSKGSSD